MDMSFCERLPRLFKYIVTLPIINSQISQQDSLEVLSIRQIIEKSSKNEVFKCKLKAKIANFLPLESKFHNVYVKCKLCSYLNTLPLNLVNRIEQPDKLYRLFKQNVSSKSDLVDYTKNFSIDWINEATLNNFERIIDFDSNQEILSYLYDCPRCAQLRKIYTPLDFVYRFRIVLGQEAPNVDKLGICLIDNDIAFKLVNELPAEKYLLISDTRLKIDSWFAKLLKTKFIFTIETLTQNEKELYVARGESLYKILDMKKE
jgi:hypothetical protein